MRNTKIIKSNLTSISTTAEDAKTMTIAKTSDEILREREALDRQLEAALKAEYSAAVEDLKAKILKYKVPPEDLFDLDLLKKPRVKNPPKYRNPTTGETWSGRGPAPAWIDGKDRTLFLVSTSTADAGAGASDEHAEKTAPAAISDGNPEAEHAATPAAAPLADVVATSTQAPAEASAKDPFFA